MDTDEDQRQGQDSDIQDHYDQQFSQLTSPQHYNKTATPGELSSAENQDYTKPANASPVALGGASLQKAESNPTTDLSDKGVTSEVNPSFRDRAGGFLKKRRNQVAIASGGGLIGLGVGGMMMFSNLFPMLRINGFVQTLQDHFFASSSVAIDKGTNKLLNQYIVKKVVPGMVTNHCSSTLINKNCAAKSDATTPVGALYNAWKDAKLENTLASKYGIQIVRVGKNKNSFYLRTDKLQHDIFLGDYTPGNTRIFDNQAFSQLSRTEVRQQVTRALSDESLYQRMKYRFLVGSLLDNKFDIRRCIMGCNSKLTSSRDKLNDNIDAKKTAFQSWLNERVVAPRTEMYSLAVDCALSNFDCVGGDEIGDDGRHTNEFDRSVQLRLADFKARYGETDLDKMFTESRELREKGATDYMISKLFAKLGVQTSVRLADFTNPIGWIDLGAHILVGAKNAGPAIKSMSYAMYSQTAVATYMLYRTSADELKAGQADVTELGSLSESLDASPKNDQGGLSGEDAPVYEAITGDRKTPDSVAAALFPTASAASSQNSNSVGPYTCDDGKPLASDKLACDEEIAGHTNWFGDLSNFASLGISLPMNSVQVGGAEMWVKISDALTGVAGKIIGASLGLLKHIPLFGDFYSWAASHLAEFAQSILETFIKYVIPSQLTDHTSGARLVQIAGAGADFLANDYAHFGIGGHVLSPSEVASIQQEQAASSARSFAQQPLFARLFSTELPNSLLSRIAMATPTSFSSFSTSFANMLNPLHNLASAVNGMVPGNSASAAFANDPFGITQYGLTDADLAKIGDDAEGYWKTNCSDIVAVNKAWGEAATQDVITRQYDNTTPNLCLALQSFTAAAGGLYNQDLIQTQFSQGAAAAPTTSATTGPLNQSTIFQNSADIACAPGTNNLGIQDGYHDGIKVPIRVCGIPGLASYSSESTSGPYAIKGADSLGIVNSRVSANVLAMVKAAKTDGVTLSANSTFRSEAHQVALCEANTLCRQGTYTLVARPGTSNHQMGIAIDFSEPSVRDSSAQNCTTRVRDNSSAQWRWLNNNAAKFGFKQYSAESWHWDALVSANRCGGDGS
jgi:hypothetical protein